MILVITILSSKITFRRSNAILKFRYGFCCVAELFEHSDFNVEEADGWSVRVQEGRLQAGQLAKQGWIKN